MANIFDHMKWKLFCKKEETFIRFAAEKGLIKPYDDSFLNRMKNYYYHGVPGSLMLLSPDLVSGRVFEMCPFLALGLEDNFRIVYAYVKSIKLNPDNIDKCKENDIVGGKHCFVEVVDDNNQTWIYDPLRTFIYDKDIYYEIEEPEIISTLTRAQYMQNPAYLKIKNAPYVLDDYSKEKILPLLDNYWNLTTYYDKRLINELENFYPEETPKK